MSQLQNSLTLVLWSYNSLSICKASCESQFGGVGPALLHAQIDNLPYSCPASDARHQEHDPKVDSATNADKNIVDTYPSVGADLGKHERVQSLTIRRIGRVNSQVVRLFGTAHCNEATSNSI